MLISLRSPNDGWHSVTTFHESIQSEKHAYALLRQQQIPSHRIWLSLKIVPNFSIYFTRRIHASTVPCPHEAHRFLTLRRKTRCFSPIRERLHRRNVHWTRWLPGSPTGPEVVAVRRVNRVLRRRSRKPEPIGCCYSLSGQPEKVADSWLNAEGRSYFWEIFKLFKKEWEFHVLGKLSENDDDNYFAGNTRHIHFEYRFYGRADIGIRLYFSAAHC